MKTSAEKFFEVRDTLGLTQIEFGQYLGITCVTVRNYEKSEPLLNEHQRFLLQKIGINPAFILCDDQSMLIKGKSIVDAREAVRKEVSA